MAATVEDLDALIDTRAARRRLAPLFPARDLNAACRAWQESGSMGLSAWLARYKERTTGRRNFEASKYGDAVRAVRAALEDETDYSKDNA